MWPAGVPGPISVDTQGQLSASQSTIGQKCAILKRTQTVVDQASKLTLRYEKWAVRACDTDITYFGGCYSSDCGAHCPPEVHSLKYFFKILTNDMF